MEFKMKELYTINGINKIVGEFYNLYNRKASINFAGSKGYLCHIYFDWEIEGKTLDMNNRIDAMLPSETLLQWDKSGIKILKSDATN